MRQEPVDLYCARDVGEMDRRAIEDVGTDGYELMCRAGRAAYRVLRERWPDRRRIEVVCGSGNNGGDGYVVARLAREDGLEARLVQLGDPQRIGGTAARAREDWLEAGGEEQAGVESLGGNEPELFVDAMLGTGLDREVEGKYRRAVEYLNGTGRPVLAIDTPSGLHADTGQSLGVAARANATVTFIGCKRGLFTGQAPDIAGEVIFDDLDVPARVRAGIEPGARMIREASVARLLGRRDRTAHKGRFGHVAVLGGDHGMPGASRLAAEAALRAGAGLVSVGTRPAHVAAVAGARPELMCRGLDSDDDVRSLLAPATVVAVGPGLGQGDWGRRLLDLALASGRPLVVDADGLNLLSTRSERRDDWVLTPHPGEAARLLDCPTAGIQGDRFAAAEEIAGRYGGAALLKGAGTVVAGAGAPPAVSTPGNPGMASGGMGDVLTGIVAGLLAQGASPREAAEAGAWIHGTAGDRAARAGERGLLAGDLMAELRLVVNPGERS